MANSAGPRGNQEANPERKKVFGGQRGAERREKSKGRKAEEKKQGRKAEEKSEEEKTNEGRGKDRASGRWVLPIACRPNECGMKM